MLTEIALFMNLTLFKPQSVADPTVVLASRTYSMDQRYAVASVNQVFKDNILLTLKYLDGSIKSKSDISWPKIDEPFHSEFSLDPGKSFAFHDQVMPKYKDSVVKTTNAHFNSTDGFVSDGWLVGDGVCHLASFMHMVALDAGLTSESLASHDFAKINEVPREFGVSIKYMPGEFANSSRQNLYITNTQDKPITFKFDYDGKNLTVSVTEAVN
jgi:hypothetical protein